jgi:hypothetical protein
VTGQTPGFIIENQIQKMSFQFTLQAPFNRDESTFERRVGVRLNQLKQGRRMSEKSFHQLTVFDLFVPGFYLPLPCLATFHPIKLGPALLFSQVHKNAPR